MVGSALEEKKEPLKEDVLSALNDEDCREIIRNIEEPMTAKELSEATGIPKSTLYRKLDALTNATLLIESMRLRKDGKHTSVYSVGFERVIFEVDENRDIELEIARPRAPPDERIESLWKEVGKEI